MISVATWLLCKSSFQDPVPVTLQKNGSPSIGKPFHEVTSKYFHQSLNDVLHSFLRRTCVLSQSLLVAELEYIQLCEASCHPEIRKLLEWEHSKKESLTFSRKNSSERK
ncbi:hypothetical protein Pelo_11231 [Pelomyxa schiedti]|nr:hypothetical protein Pelo_11231 [Pelomyxa schiedti]